MSQSLTTTIFRGMLGKCPNCGKGKIFQRYLKVNESCQRCEERLFYEGSDDAPAYLTIVLMGHFLVPILIYVEMNYDLPLWLIAGIALPLTLGLTLAILPRVKGIVVTILWRLKRLKS